MSERLTPEQRRLVEQNHGLAEKISHDFSRKSSAINNAEVVSAAYQGLIRAAQMFDESRGVPFGAYARQKITSAIMDWQRDVDYLERLVRRDYKVLQRAGVTVGAPLSRRILADLHERTGLAPERISYVLSNVEAAENQGSYTEQFINDDEAPDEAYLAPDDVESSTRMSVMQAGVIGTIKNLPQTQQVVMAYRYFQGKTLGEIAAILDLSPALVKEAHSEAVLAVHAEMARQARMHH